VLDAYIAAFASHGLPVIASRDWHPGNHCSFEAQGGTWPVHCVANTDGANFAPGLTLPESVTVVSKATQPSQEAYSSFEGTDLAERLGELGVRRLFIGGLATDYCVLATVRDALELGFETSLLIDAVRAVNVRPGDGERALREMRHLGANPVRLAQVAA
jgi:nicotinamidase/pyrazinamidase